jgi:hypothetical protein
VLPLGFRQEVETVQTIYMAQRPSLPPARGPVTHLTVGRFRVESRQAAPTFGSQGTGVSVIGTFVGKGLPVAQAALGNGDIRGVPPRGKPV